MYVIYDFETMSKNPMSCAVLSAAFIKIDPRRFRSINPYEYLQLVDMAQYIKFNIQQQVEELNRVISTDTLQWWKSLPLEVQKSQMYPTKNDVLLEKFTEVFDSFYDKSCKLVFTRGNGFDPIILESIYKLFDKKIPYHWGAIRDTRSWIESITSIINTRNDFIPPDILKLVKKHDPRHDVALDAYRMQYIQREVFGADPDEEIPF